jgi:phosphoglycolate phosphatase
VIARNGLYAPLFVGDTEGDRDAARACGVPFAHVTYGFGHCGGADLVVGSFAELVARVLPPELDGPVGLPRKE